MDLLYSTVRRRFLTEGREQESKAALHTEPPSEGLELWELYIPNSPLSQGGSLCKLALLSCSRPSLRNHLRTLPYSCQAMILQPHCAPRRKRHRHSEVQFISFEGLKLGRLDMAGSRQSSWPLTCPGGRSAPLRLASIVFRRSQTRLAFGRNEIVLYNTVP